MKKDVAVIMGSQSDYKVMKDIEPLFNMWNITYDLKIVSAHRSPDLMMDFAKTASNKYQVIIAGAGGSAHLPGMVASWTMLPVIGVPITSKMNGIDSICSIISMPFGTPVATVGINASKNAALLALRILALINNNHIKTLKTFKKQQYDMVLNSENNFDKKK